MCWLSAVRISELCSFLSSLRRARTAAKLPLSVGLQGVALMVWDEDALCVLETIFQNIGCAVPESLVKQVNRVRGKTESELSKAQVSSAMGHMQVVKDELI